MSADAAEGKRRIAWAERSMPVLRILRERFSREKPLRNHRIAARLAVKRRYLASWSDGA